MHADKKLALLQKAADRARHHLPDILARCRSGEYQVHDTADAVAITAVTVSGPFRTLYIVAVAGELSALPALGNNCQAIETNGRLGFDRLYRELGVFDGWRQVAVKYRKVL